MTKKIGLLLNVSLLVLLPAVCSESLLAKAPSPSAELLRTALQKEDPELIRAAVSAAREELGDKAGLPEIADKYIPVPKDAQLLSPAEARRGFSKDFTALEKMVWWKIGIDPRTVTAPLRGPASVLSGNVATVRAKLDGAERSLAMAKDAAEFLMWAQQQAGAGLFPFPAARGPSNQRAMQAATRFLDLAEKAGKIDSVLRNGWAFEDLGDGGLQFDNGECGVAMFELHDLTKDTRYLDSARRATDWALGRPLCPNWNYNSFSVQLLAKAFAITGEAKYLDGAIRKARLGVIPGQLTDGPRVGRWMDPHNTRPAYHYIMLRALAELVAVMPQEHPDRAAVLGALALGLKARNSEIVTRGVMTKDKAIEVLLLVNRIFRNEDAFLHATQSREALQTVSLLISSGAARGKAPLSPGEWGQFLESIADMGHP
jgi:hypothetical protein